LDFHQVNHIVARGLYRRSGITPCPEGTVLNLI